MAFAGTGVHASGDIANRGTLSDAPAGGVAGLNKLWLPLWSGEVIHSYDQYNVFENLITSKSLTGGFSYEFPVTGTVGLNASWDAGEELGGVGGSSTTFKVNLDKRPMAAHFETDNVDALVTQWDYRSELARQSGQTLANTRDKQLGVALLAASLIAPLGFSTTANSGSAADPRGGASGYARTDFPQPAVVGTVNTAAVGVAVTNCTELTAVNILKAIEDYFVFMQEHDYPTNNVYCVVTPKVFQVIRGLGITRAADLAATPPVGGNFTKYPMFAGNSDMGMLGGPLGMGMNALSDSLEYMGCRIIKSNHLPSNKDYSTSVIGSSKYNLNSTYFDVFGFIFQPEAIAGLSLMGMKVDTVQDVRRNTQFTVASMMKGTGVIRPELCQALVGVNSATDYDTAAEIDTRLECAALINTTNLNLSTGFAAEYAVTS